MQYAGQVPKELVPLSQPKGMRFREVGRSLQKQQSMSKGSNTRTAGDQMNGAIRNLFRGDI